MATPRGRGVPGRGEPLTNIGTTIPPRVPLTGPLPPRLVPGAGALPLGIPVAQFEGEKPGAKQIAANPLWVARWQPSATPPNQPRPWVVGYRWWVAGVHYASGWNDPLYRIDLKWRDHAHAYHGIPRYLWEEFRQLTGSVGRWFHRKILGPDWRPGKGSMWPDFAL